MATNKEIKINGVMTPVTDFSHTSQEIDDATTRALEGGAIDQLLAGKAPAGYGLGSSGASISDCNLATSNGFYKWGSACDNAPFTYGCMIVASRYNTGTINLAQLAFQQTTTAGIARRSVIDGVFGEWEWINPPMVIGVEYRTTERYNGKPVYVKAIATGAMPSASGLSNRVKIDTGILTSKVDAIVRWGGTVTNGGTVFTLPTALGVNQVVELSGFTTPYNEYVVYIESSNDKSDYSGTLVFAYTKKAD